MNRIHLMCRSRSRGRRLGRRALRMGSWRLLEDAPSQLSNFSVDGFINYGHRRWLVFSFFFSPGPREAFRLFLPSLGLKLGLKLNFNLALAHQQPAHTYRLRVKFGACNRLLLFKTTAPSSLTRRLSGRVFDVQFRCLLPVDRLSTASSSSRAQLHFLSLPSLPCLFLGD
ncbi:hypothetical protein GALMADRAFT_1208647 [Galerina marginata CBS 339.88]|uniref:Uncharacterized protein n=1 Tax=Galerina marginata (strain CBS 339.88) TaxID=685588 RepID=A0A067SH65_GALM3|nr:hypothetical protein GALMADRAFT_1208647 [Galerina marginata CBS 339.88]